MTALMMPTDYGMEMMLGSSPVFGSSFLASHGPFLSDLSRFQSIPSIWQQPQDAPTVITASGQPESGGFDRESEKRPSIRRRRNGTIVEPLILSTAFIPSKSCLVLKSPDEEDGATSPTKEKKKKVSFADDSGLNLTETRLFSERSDSPPRWTNDFIEKVSGAFSPETSLGQWELTFSQPASDYMGFKSRLERDNVALENVLMTEHGFNATVKVRNLSFHKKVYLRYTTDSWVTYTDVSGEYLQAASSTGLAYSLYDSFAVRVPLPPAAVVDKVEFCICFTCNGQEFWDNNNGRNYGVVSQKKKEMNKKDKPGDVYDLTIEAWSEFASWNHLRITDTPYW